MKTIHTSKNFIYFVFFLLVMGTFYPFVHNYVLFGDNKAIITIAALAIWSFCVFLKQRGILFLPHKTFNIIIFIQAGFFFIWSFITSSRSIMNYCINVLEGWYILTLILNSIDVNYFLKSFIKINIISLILSIMGLILVLLGIIDLYSVHDYNGEFKIYNYLLFFIKRTEETDLNFRVAGYYDEPGSFAFIVMFLLLLNKRYYKNMKWEYLLLLLPLITTSMAHIITAFLFVLIFYFNKRHITKIIGLTTVLLMIIIALLKHNDYDYINYFTDRTIYRVEGFLSGEGDAGRGAGYETGYEIYRKNKLGISPEKIREQYPFYVHEVGWSPLLYFGIIGYPFYLLIFIYLFTRSVKDKDKNAILSLIIILVNLIQRPNYTYPIYIILMYFLFFSKCTYDPRKYITLKVSPQSLSNVQASNPLKSKVSLIPGNNNTVRS